MSRSDAYDAAVDFIEYAVARVDEVERPRLRVNACTIDPGPTDGEARILIETQDWKGGVHRFVFVLEVGGTA